MVHTLQDASPAQPGRPGGRLRGRPRGLHRLSIPLAITVAAILVLAGSVGPVMAYSWPVDSFSSSSEAELAGYTNQARAAAGLPALRIDSALTSIARWRSQDMITRDYFSHYIPPSNQLVFYYMKQKGYCFTTAGENIGWNNYPVNLATAAIQQQFMGSAGHKANILGSAWNVMGIGAYQGPTGKKMWTVIFAKKCSSAPAPTPKPTPKPTPRPTPKPTPKPAATARPASTATATPSPSPSPSPSPTEPPDRPIVRGPVPSSSSPSGPPSPSPRATPVQAVQPPPAGGLLDTIVGSAAGLFFGD